METLLDKLYYTRSMPLFLIITESHRHTHSDHTAVNTSREDLLQAADAGPIDIRPEGCREFLIRHTVVSFQLWTQENNPEACFTSG